MLSISQSMAVKSLQLDRDVQLESLVAYQSYLFNAGFGGVEYQPDVYTGLHNALKGLLGVTYNNLPGHKGGVNAMVFAPGKNVLYSAGSDGQIISRDIDEPKENFKVLFANPFMNRSIATNDDGSLLAVGTSESVIQIFSLKNPTLAPTLLTGHSGVVLSLAFVPGTNELYSVGADKQLILWQTMAGTFKVLSDSILIRSIIVSPNGNYLVAGTEKEQLIVMDRKNNKSSILYHDKGNPVLCLAYNNNGSLLVSGDNEGTLTIWDMDRKNIKTVLSGHSARIFDVEFSPDNRKIASCSTDGTALMWETSDLNNQPIVITEHESWVLSVAFSSDGRYLVTSGNKGEIMLLWPTKTATLAERTFAGLQRNMTSQEWETYVGSDIPLEKTKEKKPDSIKK